MSGFLVKATQKGYYNNVIREEGQVFHLKDPKHFAEHGKKELNGLGWMERVEEVQASKKGKKPQQIGNRPAPPNEDDIVQRMSEADRMADEAAESDKEADVI